MTTLLSSPNPSMVDISIHIIIEPFHILRHDFACLQGHSHSKGGKIYFHTLRHDFVCLQGHSHSNVGKIYFHSSP